MGCGSSAQPKALALLAARDPLSPLAAKTLLSPAGSKPLRGTPAFVSRQSLVPEEQCQEAALTEAGSLPGAVEAPPAVKEALEGSSKDLKFLEEAYAPGLQGNSQVYLASLYCALSSKQELGAEAAPTEAPITKAYAPRMQHQQQQYLTCLEQALSTQQAHEVTVEKPSVSTDIFTSEPYVPRLQQKSQQYLTSLEQAFTIFESAPLMERAAPSKANAEVDSPHMVSLQKAAAAEYLPGDKAATAKGLAAAAEAAADSNTRAAAGLAVMAAAVAKAMPTASHLATVAVGLAKASSGAAEAGSSAAPGLVRAAAASVRAAAEAH